MNETYQSIISYKTTDTGASEYEGLKEEDQELYQLCGKEDEFIKKMGEEFGEDLFNEAYNVIKDNMQDVFDDTNSQLP
jgi:phosphate starvation-inducible protein PhoH